ncbi:MAG: sugar transferase [Chloroflexi bacterium]|nr:sugar transferase [Chloroflexota bacterium]MBK9748291.1 sugar transferase [Chloroflexota bacterium]
MSGDRVKRLFDVALASGLLILFSPVMLICALAIGWNMGRPILFLQPRIGRGGAIFTVYKFRTMLPPTTPNGRQLSDAERITRLGNRLRRSHFDEVPQLINVLRGEMSLVGPRPLLPQYLERYTARQARRHEVQPGITGWAQIHGANALSWDEKFELDVWYVDHRSPLIDLDILGRTALMALMSLVTRRAEPLTTEFTGSQTTSNGDQR